MASGAFGVLWEAFKCFLVISGGASGGLWVFLGSLWGASGGIWGVSGLPLGVSGGFWGSSGEPLECLWGSVGGLRQRSPEHNQNH